MAQTPQVIVAGSGLAAAATARAVVAAGLSVTLIDEREPVSSHPIGEAEWYSAWWPGGDVALARFASVGIDRLEALHRESGEAFGINRRGMLFLTGRAETARSLEVAAGRHAASGGGPIREHLGAEWYLKSPSAGFRGVSDGLDLLAGGALRTVFPFLAPSARLGIHVRRAGWVDGRRLRRWLLSACRADGGIVVPDTIAEIGHYHGQWTVRLASGARLTSPILVLAGPRARLDARRAGLSLPWLEATRMLGYLEAGGRILSETAPAVVGLDPATGAPGLPQQIPAGLGSGPPLLLATGQGAVRVETVAVGPIRPSGLMAMGESVLRELAALVPDLATRRGPPGAFSVAGAPLSLVEDGRPVVGVADRRGGYLLTGFGGEVASLLAAADLLTAYLLGRPLPDYAPHLAPARLVRAVDRVSASPARS